MSFLHFPHLSIFYTFYLFTYYWTVRFVCH